MTVSLIALNCAVFIYELLLGSDLRGFMMQWGLVPGRLNLALHSGGQALTPALATLVTSMLLHGGWAHLVGNMWYLWIFGDNIEDHLGHTRFLLFYLGGGVIAALTQFAIDPTATIPTVGASGAIAAVLGAYAVTFPRARVVTLLPLMLFWPIVRLSALAVLGLWFVFQFFTGALALAWAAGGGIAWWAHVGGFLFGVLAIRLIPPRAPGRSGPGPV